MFKKQNKIDYNSPIAEKAKILFAEFFKKEKSLFLTSLDDVYNADETGLMCKSLPSKSPASKREAEALGFQASKESVMIL